MRLVAVLTLAFTFAGAAHARPNVLLVVTDDQRWDTLRWMPTVQAELVGKGVNFTNSFVVNPLCCPARASILTGTYSHTNGVWGNPGAGAYGGFGAFDDSWTLPVWLRELGYETMLVGKYLNGYDEVFTPAAYVPPGWDRWFTFWGRPAQSYFGYQISDGVTATPYGFDPGDYATDVIAEEAVRLIREVEGPFFLYFAPKAPHWSGSQFNVDPAPRHVGAFSGVPLPRPASLNESDVSDKPQHMRKRNVWLTKLSRLREEQLESLLAVDEAIAAMLTALEETGKLADTVIVFTSDNGYLWGEHRWAGKIVPYEESLRVPLVVRYDALDLPARESRRAALNIDLASTIVEAAGGVVQGLEGRSLLPLMAADVTWRKSFLFEHFNRPAVVPAYCGFRSSRWKYVQYGTGEEELYDLRSDPHELRNLRAAHRRTDLIVKYRERVRRSACRPPGFTPLRPTPCTITGTKGPDRIRGTKRRDWVCAGPGRDWIDVRGGRRDVVRCGSGFDRVRAGARDVLIGCEVRL